MANVESELNKVEWTPGMSELMQDKSLDCMDEKIQSILEDMIQKLLHLKWRKLLKHMDKLEQFLVYKNSAKGKTLKK